MLHAQPGGVAVSALLFGEPFAVLDVAAGWAWGRTLVDGYVGFVQADALDVPVAATSRVAAGAALVFEAPDIKSAVVARLPLNARLATRDHDDRFLALEPASSVAGFIHRRHVAPVDRPDHDPLAVARLLLGTPYRWGGRTRDGIDCSGLVQAALLACGIECPRDSDQQRHALGAGVTFDDRRRGDLVFFPGHVGILADAARLLHANAHAMTTCIEPLEAVIGRLRDHHAEPVLAVRRVETGT